ncbi:MAG: hypothetical protein RR565_01830 [Erysipelothrix sp.]
MNLYKKYIDVTVYMDAYGELTPLVIHFKGDQYPIKKIYAIKKAFSPVGGSGIMYECQIQNERRNIFYERSRWFIESHHP